MTHTQGQSLGLLI